MHVQRKGKMNIKWDYNISVWR